MCFSNLYALGAGNIAGKGISCVSFCLLDRIAAIKMVHEHTRIKPKMIVFELFRQYSLVLSAIEFVSISVGCGKCY